MGAATEAAAVPAVCPRCAGEGVVLVRVACCSGRDEYGRPNCCCGGYPIEDIDTCPACNGSRVAPPADLVVSLADLRAIGAADPGAPDEDFPW